MKETQNQRKEVRIEHFNFEVPNCNLNFLREESVVPHISKCLGVSDLHIA